MSSRLVGTLIGVLVAGCSSFEDPTVVIDLRVLAMTASPPEQIVDVDLMQPVMPAALLQQLQDTEICALVADPGVARDLRWSMTLCLLDEEGRCDPAHPRIELGSGVITDPDSTPTDQVPCAFVLPQDPRTGQKLLLMLQAAVEANPVQALGGIDYTVVFTIGAVDDRSTDIYAAKHLRVSPLVPRERTANRNPDFDFIEASPTTGGGLLLAAGRRARCAKLTTFEIPRVPPGSRITLFPVESPAAREEYVVPTLDGRTAMLTETITYQWFATYGAWSDEFTGGGHDVLGNQSLLGSDWIAPSTVSDPLLVSLWMIQRDERYGVQWFETCIMVSR